ncbi:MAG: pantetheine-phosphate adenylyltransferase [Nitrospiraceae bacterium]|nr:pantetheine-phosphate adenylyltransferase [Nitrospiraceae bacterium]
MNKVAVCPGTFDPITNGHIDIIKRGLRIFDEVIVAITTAQKKQPLFTVEERLEIIKDVFKNCKNVRVEKFDGLLIDYVKARSGLSIIRGLRAISDFEYEFQMALMNRRLNLSVETVFMMPSEEYTFLTSTIIKEIASFGGTVKGLVPQVVEEALRRKFRRQ